MNNGNRQDTIIDHHSYWNWLKTVNMPYTLQRELLLAKSLFISKHAAFKTMCRLYSDKLREWDKADRHQRLLVGKEITCVYR
ncbi:hypothetical protein CPC08DRAFT_798420 [Agrocybe pediades]|nr:hypothetical protein CPC08DRAFT_798420 [Agrocybe pediades]